MAARMTHLDRWARVLAVSNDGDAAGELAALQARLKVMAYQLLRVQATLRNAPDSEITDALDVAAQEAINLWGSTSLVKRKFEVHARGGQ